MDLMRFARWPMVLLLVVAAVGLVAALLEVPWAWSVGATDDGAPGGLSFGFHLGVVQAVLLGLVAGVGTVATIYSARNLVGQHRLGRFAALEMAVIFSLAVMVTADSLLLLAGAWTMASLAIAGLVGHAGTTQARHAARQVRGRLLVGDAVLWASVVVTGTWVGTWSLAGLPGAVATASTGAIVVASLLLVGAGVVRSALLPSHRWLPETAEAPSPVSALLHSGLVNGVGVLALVMWPLVAAAAPARLLLVVLGAATALVATAHVRTRADVKGRLAASTSSQMGYLAIQVGLGIPAAVLAHVVGHGVWKAAQFLGAGDVVARARRASPSSASSWSLRVVLGSGALAVVVVGAAAVVPAMGWPAFLAPGEMLPLAVAVGATWLGMAAILRSTVRGAARTLASAVILVGAAGYIVALRALGHVLASSLGEPAPWDTMEGRIIAVVVGLLLVLGYLGVRVDRRARAGRMPGLARSAGLASLRPLTVRERLTTAPQVALAVPPVSDADARIAREHIAVASSTIGALYPLTAFVASNPLGGLEDLSFAEAAKVGAELWGARPGPTAAVLRRALDEGRVTSADVDSVVAEAIGGALDRGTSVAGVWLDRGSLARSLLVMDPQGVDGVKQARAALRRAEILTGRHVRTPLEAAGVPPRMDARVSQVVAHCCARSLAGTAWPGAGGPWSELQASAARLDRLLGMRGAGDIVRALPAEPAAASAALLEHLGLALRDRPALIGRVLARQPGWAAHLIWRERHARLGREAGLQEDTDTVPGMLMDQLVAARLAVEVVVAEGHAPALVGRPLRAQDLVRPDVSDDLASLLPVAFPGVDFDSLADDEVRAAVELLAPLADGQVARLRGQILEHANRIRLLDRLGPRAAAIAEEGWSADRPAPAEPAGQVIMCIDVRSERLRRRLEQVGPWETFGAAGFFGIPLRYSSIGGSDSERAPALLRPSVPVTETPLSPRGLQGSADALADCVGSLESAPGLVFGWAEAFGWLLAPAVMARTVLPGWTRRCHRAVRSRLASPTHGELDVAAAQGALVEAAVGFLSTTGLHRFAPVVVLCGHGATVTNNPHVAAYDCGACGGAAGDVSARTMAQILNDPAVRVALQDEGIDIPAHTRFVAALHDTTTDQVRLLDEEPISGVQSALVERLLCDAALAGSRVRTERVPLLPTGARVPPADRLMQDVADRAADWAQPRPEWGLAGAETIVVGPRRLTEGLDLDGRVFLQSYRPDLDADGSALEQLLAAPVVVAQWITSQYWASVIDPEHFGAGDKTTHNVVGDSIATSAVITGAHGDLRLGLPWQAVSAVAPSPSARSVEDPWPGGTRHQPQRLLAVVYARPSTIDGALRRQPSARRLVVGEWITLCAVDPDTGCVLRWTGDERWVVEQPERLAVAEDFTDAM